METRRVDKPILVEPWGTSSWFSQSGAEPVGTAAHIKCLYPFRSLPAPSQTAGLGGVDDRM